MNRSLFAGPSRVFLALAFGASAAAPLSADVGTSGWTERVSFTSDGLPIPEDAIDVDVSAEGHIVAYCTTAALMPGDDNGARDVYVYNRDTGKLVCVSTNAAGDFGNGHSDAPSVSVDGRWVAFQSEADNLAGVDANGRVDVFLRDLKDWTLRLVSKPDGGAVSSDGHSLQPSVSASGRYVAFQSNSSNLLPGDANGVWDIYIHDVLLNTQYRASRALAGEPNDACREPSISDDGMCVSYHSAATNLAAMDNNGLSDAFVHDVGSGATSLVSRTMGGSSANGHSYSTSLAGDGSRVVFLSLADDLHPADPNTATDVYLADLPTGAIELVSISHMGSSGANGATYGDISRDGRFAAFVSHDDMLPQSTPFQEVYVRDLVLGQTWLASRPEGAVALADDKSMTPRLIADGSVVFISESTNFDPADTNGVRDVYVRTMVPDPFVYCMLNETTDGCNPDLFSMGYPSARMDGGFELYVDEVPPDRPALLFYGFQGPSEVVFKSGYLCVAGSLRRASVVQSSGHAGQCNGSISFDMNAFAAGALGGNPSPLLTEAGQQVNAQFWGRDNPKGLHGVYMTEAIQYVVGP